MSSKLLLAAGLLLVTAPVLNAAAIRPVSNDPLVSRKPSHVNKYIDVDTKHLRPVDTRYNNGVGSDVQSIRGFKDDFNSADRWKKQLKNPNGLPIPRIVTHAPEITLTPRSTPPERADASEDETPHLIRREYGYGGIYDYPIPFPTYAPQQVSQQDEDEARLAEYEAFKSEMKQIPEDAGIPCSERGPSWIISDRRYQKAMEAEAEAAAAAVADQQSAVEVDHDECAGESEVAGQESMSTGNSSEHPGTSHERSQMDDAEEVLDQFSLLRGPLQSKDCDRNLHKRWSYDPLRQKKTACNGVISLEHPNVHEHASPLHKAYCPNEVLRCGKHCYSPSVISVGGQLRTYNPPEAAEHPPRPRLRARAVDVLRAPDEASGLPVPVIIAPTVVNDIRSQQEAPITTPMDGSFVVGFDVTSDEDQSLASHPLSLAILSPEHSHENAGPSGTSTSDSQTEPSDRIFLSVAPMILEPGSSTEHWIQSDSTQSLTPTATILAASSQTHLNEHAAPPSSVKSSSSSSLHIKWSKPPTETSYLPLSPSVTAMVGDLKENENVVVVAQGLREDGAIVRLWKKVTAGVSDVPSAAGTPEPTMTFETVTQETHQPNEDIVVSHERRNQPVLKYVGPTCSGLCPKYWEMPEPSYDPKDHLRRVRRSQIPQQTQSPGTYPLSQPRLKHVKGGDNESTEPMPGLKAEDVDTHKDANSLGTSSETPGSDNLVVQLAAAGILDTLDGNDHMAIRIVDVDLNSPTPTVDLDDVVGINLRKAPSSTSTRDTADTQLTGENHILLDSSRSRGQFQTNVQ